MNLAEAFTSYGKPYTMQEKDKDVPEEVGSEG